MIPPVMMSLRQTSYICFLTGDPLYIPAEDPYILNKHGETNGICINTMR